MTTQTHECINGRRIDYEPSPAETRFVKRVEAAIDDRKVGEGELRALIYGPENPLLAQQHGYTFVTAAAFEAPVFRVLLDLFDRKRIATGALDLKKAAARYTMNVGQAARQLGLAEASIRTAVLTGRLPAWMVDGEIRLDPATVDGYEVSRRGRPPKLQVVCGSADGASMRVRVDDGELQVTHKNGEIVTGEIDKWSRVGVITSAKRAGEPALRYWLLEPGGPQRRVELGPFSVVGRFTVAEQKSGKAATAAWSAPGDKAGKQYAFDDPAR